MSISQHELSRLIASEDEPCASIYMPMFPAGREQRQNPIRFENILKDTEKLLGYEPDQAKATALLKKLRGFGKDAGHDVWQHPQRGLAVLATAERIEAYQFDSDLPEQVHVGERFYLRPLLPLLPAAASYLVLVVSQNSVRLFEGTGGSFAEVPTPQLPKDLEDALRVDEYTSSLQYFGFKRGADGEAVFHGHGAGDDDHAKELLQFFHRLDGPLSRFLAERNDPLLFAGVEYLFPIFKEAVRYTNLLSVPLAGNFDDASPAEIHEQAQGVMDAEAKNQIRSHIRAYHDSFGSDKACRELPQVVVAASRGAVDLLLIREGAQCWGHVDRENNIVLEDEPSETTLDLVDEVAHETLRHGGSVAVVDADSFPADDQPCVAILRYPISEAVAR